MKKDKFRSGFAHQKIRNFSGGFTLIELLVVISIISLLSSVVLSSLNSARVKSRDAKRISELRELSTALELFYHDNGRYPNTPNTGTPDPNNPLHYNTYAGCWTGTANWIPDASPAGSNYNWSDPYIKKQPQDPKDMCCWPWGNCGSAGDPGTYEYWSNGQKFMLAARLEDISNKNRAGVTGVIDPRTATPYSARVPLGTYVYVITR